MGTLFSYSLSASAVILLLFPILHQIVNRCTSFRFNRLAILCGLALSLALPNFFEASFPEITAAGPISPDNIVPASPVTSAQNETAATFPWLATMLIVYLSGIIILSFREIFSFLRLFRLIAVSEKRKGDGLTVCLIKNNETAPFSWGNFIFLHESEFENAGCIYIHEKAHTVRRHWIDVLFADFFCILLWYNPLAWKTRQLMKLNHELGADEAVIRTGVETYDYQRLLVANAMKMRAIPVCNSFAATNSNFSKRVLTMSRKRSSKKPMLIALCAIPAVALAGTAVTTPDVASLLSDISGYSLTSEPLPTDNQSNSEPIVPDSEIGSPEIEAEAIRKIPSPFQDQTALADIIRLSLETIQVDKDTKVNIQITVDKDGRVKGVSSDTPDGAEVAAAISQKFNGITLEQITENGKPIEVHFVVPVQLKKKE